VYALSAGEPGTEPLCVRVVGWGCGDVVGNWEVVALSAGRTGTEPQSLHHRRTGTEPQSLHHRRTGTEPLSLCQGGGGCGERGWGAEKGRRGSEIAGTGTIWDGSLTECTNQQPGGIFRTAREPGTEAPTYILGAATEATGYSMGPGRGARLHLRQAGRARSRECWGSVVRWVGEAAVFRTSSCVGYAAILGTMNRPLQAEGNVCWEHRHSLGARGVLGTMTPRGYPLRRRDTIGGPAGAEGMRRSGDGECWWLGRGRMSDGC
jgi:hypothetical protein